MHISCPAEFESPGFPHGAGTLPSCRWVLVQGQDGSWQCYNVPCAASQEHLYNCYTVLNCLLLLRKTKQNQKKPKKHPCHATSNVSHSSPSAYQLFPLKAWEKNYNSELCCQQRNNNSFKKPQCFFLGTDSPVDKIRGVIKSVPEPSPAAEPHFQPDKQKLYLQHTENRFQALPQHCGSR